MTIQIDHDIPIPYDRRSKYPWERMQVGDSFFVAKKSSYLHNSAKNKSRDGRVFKVHAADGGCRVWRVK